ncbi:MAG: site-specific integrase [candidate division Zixibacteria bacterium]|nr:site-specific integrase [candidate division Zixibacteria bacterium]
MKPNYENEKLKRRYRTHLVGAQGMSAGTVLTVIRALKHYEQLFEGEDYSYFNQRRAMDVKKHLEKQAWETKSLSGNTAYHTLRILKRFFSWLAEQPGFKKKISLDAVSYLSLDLRKTQEVLNPVDRPFPSLEYVLKLVHSIIGDTEIARRDRAIIAFLLLSGMRFSALISLPMGCFDPHSLRIDQDPRRGVKTKFGKAIPSKLMVFDERMLLPILDWYRYLLSERLFPNTAPLFPKTLIEQAENVLSFAQVGVSDQFWKSGSGLREILQKRSQEAGLDYFNPHSFRHAAVHLAMERCQTPEEFKAVSQNLGHSKPMTTLMNYGTLPNDRMRTVLGEINFGKPARSQGQRVSLRAITEFLNRDGIELDDDIT